MDRDIPAFNQLIMNKINQKNLYMHEQRLQNIRSSQNTRTYLSTSMNSRQNRKALQVEQDKKTEIQKHNIMLFNKMKKIMNRPDPNNRPLQQNQRNYNRMSMELNKIQEENRNMYERIERQKPTISNKKLYEERQKHLNVLKFLGKYSAHSIQNVASQNIRASQTSSRTQNTTFMPDRRKAYTTKQEHYLQDSETQVNTYAQSKPRYENVEFEDEIVDEDFNRMKAIIEAKREKRSKQRKNQQQRSQQDEEYGVEHENNIREKEAKSKRIAELRPSIPRSAKDITLYKTNKEINGCLYEIRIVRKHLTYEIRCSILNSFQSTIKLQLNQEQGTKLLQQSNYDYSSIINHLKIINNKLHLVNLGSKQDYPSSEKDVNKEEETMIGLKNQRKNNFPIINASHISEQNEEDSYQVEIKQKPLPQKQNDIDELDSLGEEEHFQKYTTQQLSQSQNNLEFIHKPTNFQQKLQQIRQNNQHFQEQKLEFSQKVEAYIKKEAEDAGIESMRPEGNYEEALEQEID